VGRRARQREKGLDPSPKAPSSEYRDAEGNLLVLRGSLSPRMRRRYGQTLAGGLDREDAWQRAVELLFEHLVVSWTISGLELSAQKELIGRYRMASSGERHFVRDSLRAHVAENFPGLEAP
jgi:hypothetical protein